jgi:anti-anti-sigma factor
MFSFIRNSSIAKAFGLDSAASVKFVDDVAVIRLEGRVSRDGGDVKLASLVQDLLRRGEQRILIDLEKVSLIDCSGVRELVMACFAAKKQRARIQLRSLSENALSVLQMAELVSVFDVDRADVGRAAFDEWEAA